MAEIPLDDPATYEAILKGAERLGITPAEFVRLAVEELIRRESASDT